MSIESVRDQFQKQNLNLKIIEFESSTANVELAAGVLDVEPARIAKTMALKLKDRNVVVVAKGDARLNNKKLREAFNCKARMVRFDDVEAVTGHPVGGVCPFGLPEELEIYLDESLKEFEVVYPAAGSTNSAVKISVDHLAEVTGGSWIDVCENQL